MLKNLEICIFTKSKCIIFFVLSSVKFFEKIYFSVFMQMQINILDSFNEFNLRSFWDQVINFETLLVIQWI